MCLMLDLAKHVYGELGADMVHKTGDSLTQCITNLRINDEKGQITVEVEGCFEPEQVLDLLPPSIAMKKRVKGLILDLSQVNSISSMALSAVFMVLRGFNDLPVHLRLGNLSSWVFRRLLLSPEPEFLDGRWSLEVRAGNAMLNIWPAKGPSFCHGYNSAGH